jgi:hypothetical protein
MSYFSFIESRKIAAHKIVQSSPNEHRYLGWTIKIKSIEGRFRFQKQRFTFYCTDSSEDQSLSALSDQKLYPNYNMAFIAAQRYLDRTIAMLDVLL